MCPRRADLGDDRAALEPLLGYPVFVVADGGSATVTGPIQGGNQNRVAGLDRDFRLLGDLGRVVDHDYDSDTYFRSDRHRQSRHWACNHDI